MKRLLLFATAAGLVAVGVGAVADPRSAARIYGLPVESDAALGTVRAMGMRDVFIGAYVALAREKPRGALGLAALLGAADFTLVSLASSKPPPTSLAIHASGALALAVAALLCKSA